MAEVASWLSWPEDSSLRQDFLSSQFALLSRDGVPPPAPKQVVRAADKSKDKDKKKKPEKASKKEDAKVKHMPHTGSRAAGAQEDTIRHICLRFHLRVCGLRKGLHVCVRVFE